MYALSAKTAACKAVPVTRAARSLVPVHGVRLPQRSVRMYAESETSSADETTAKIQAAANEALEYVKKTWEGTQDSEKPAVIIIIVGVILAQISIGATVDAVDKIPIVNKLLQLVGVAVSGVFAYRYFTDPAERETVKKSIDGFLKSVTGTN